MLTKHEFCFSPWVINKKNVLLGCKLNAIRVPHLNISAIPPSKLDYLIQNNYVVEAISKKDTYNIDNHLFGKLRKIKSDPLLNWIWISDKSFIDVANLLKKYFSLFDSSCTWEVVVDKKVILENLDNNQSEKPFIIRLSHKEPIEKKIIEELYGNLINKAKIIWIGETTEGTHVGPIIGGSNDMEKYLFATKNWYFSKKLIEFGFKDYWPLPIYTHLLSNPNGVVEAILKLIKAPSETCILIEGNREVYLWTKLTEEKTAESEFFEKQFWSKGLIRNFQINTFDSVNDGYIAKGRSPCNGVDYLEGNSGKGMDSTSALYSFVGESVERFSAWQSNKERVKFNEPQKRKRNIYGIEQFHPFGSKWEEYLKGQNIELPLREVKEEFNSNSMVLVPECLVPFPYEAPSSKLDVTTSSTAGLAVYSSYDKAVIKGALELFERDEFYNFFL